MTLTPSLELRFATKTVELSLGDSLDVVTERLSQYDVGTEEDSQMRRVYLRVFGEGVEMIFQNGRLSTVFLYVSGGPEGCGAFSGSTDLIDRKALETDDAAVFAQSLEAQGFGPAKRTYPFSIDRLNDVLRIRLEERNNCKTVMIDDGSMIR